MGQTLKTEGKVLCHFLSIPIQVTTIAEKLYSLWFLSDIDYQCRWSIILIEGFLDDLFHCSTILRLNPRQENQNKTAICYTTNVPDTT